MGDYINRKNENGGETGTGIKADGTRDVLDVCQKIKFMSAELHHFFADAFKEERKLLLFWKRTAMEEENNAKEFALIAKLKKQNVIYSLRIDLVDAEVTLIYLETLLEKLKEHPPSPAQALKIAIKVEEKLTPFHLNSIVQFSDPSFKKLFAAAMLSDQERIEIFRRAAEEQISSA